jgi:hypothetical protein
MAATAQRSTHMKMSMPLMRLRVLAPGAAVIRLVSLIHCPMQLPSWGGTPIDWRTAMSKSNQFQG